MKNVKYDLQNIIIGDGQIGAQKQLKKAQLYLRRNAQSGYNLEKQKRSKCEEEENLIAYIKEKQFFYTEKICEENFIAAGAEQRVYRYNGQYVIKLNDSIFYEYWLDYFNSLLIHNYFFKSTAYELLGFQTLGAKLFAIVKQEFIEATEIINLKAVRNFLSYNGFRNTRNNDYIHDELGIIFEGLHDENIISRNNVPYFIDTVFYLTENFYLPY